MDIIILAELRNAPMSSYDVISFIHSKFHLLISSGTVHSLLFSLERNGLIEENGMKEKESTNSRKKGQKIRNTTKCKRQNQKLHDKLSKSPVHPLKLFNETPSNRNTKKHLPKLLKTKENQEGP